MACGLNFSILQLRLDLVGAPIGRLGAALPAKILNALVRITSQHHRCREPIANCTSNLDFAPLLGAGHPESGYTPGLFLLGSPAPD